MIMSRQIPSKDFRENIKQIVNLRNKNKINDQDLMKLLAYSFDNFAQNQANYVLETRINKIADKLCKGVI